MILIIEGFKILHFRLGAESYSSLGRVGEKQKKIACPFLAKFDCGQVSSTRLYRLIRPLFVSIWQSTPMLVEEICEGNSLQYE